MERREYRTQDRCDWGEGPWEAEPDKVQWADEKTGLPCLIVRNRLGAFCGYVGVAEEHEYFGVYYMDGPDEAIDVHGGLTYSAFRQDFMREEDGICHVPDPGEPERVWWLGFDCNHSCDKAPRELPYSRVMQSGEYRDIAYVESEVRKMAAQLARM